MIPSQAQIHRIIKTSERAEKLKLRYELTKLQLSAANREHEKAKEGFSPDFVGNLLREAKRT